MALFSADLWQLHRLEMSVGIVFSQGKNGEHSASVSLSGASPQPAKERLASPRKAFSKKRKILQILFFPNRATPKRQQHIGGPPQKRLEKNKKRPFSFTGRTTF